MAAAKYTKDQIVDYVAEQSGVTKQQAGAALDAFATFIGYGVQNGYGVPWPTLGTFSPQDTAARVGRNPHTGGEVQIPAKRKVKFKPAPAIARQVNGEG